MPHPKSDFPSDDIRGYFEHPEAWTQVAQGLQRIALAIVGNERDAEDVVQGAWLEVLRDPERRTSTGWLRRVVRFRALDVLRRKRRDPVTLEAEVPEEQAALGADSSWKIDAQREVLDAVHALKEPYRSTVVLRYFEGKQPKVIASQLGVPERTVKTRLTRAHAMLRTRLAASFQNQFGNWAPALLAFSGYAGPKAGSVSWPATGALLMKKNSLIAAAFAAVVCIPLALQLRGTGPEDRLQLESSGQQVGEMGLPTEMDAALTQSRELDPGSSQAPSQAQATLEFAFPKALASESGSLGIRVMWSDGSPAAHVKIDVRPEEADDTFIMSRTVYTDFTGFAEVDRLPPGLVKVFFHRLGSEEVNVIAGEYVQINKEVPLGTTFTGRVLTPSGHPASGAHIFVAGSRGGDSLPEPTAIADGAGHYEIKSVFDHSYVSARASGFSPSIPIETGVSTGEAMELDLTLRANPATLRGLALSPTGGRVVGAKIRINLGRVNDDPQGRTGFPLSFVLETDADGRFETDQVGAGAITITARTATWQPWVSALRLDADETSDVTIQFKRGVELTGVVRDESGDPIPEARLISGQGAGLENYHVRTDEDGRFQIQGLPPGTLDLLVFHKEFEELDAQVTLRPDVPNQVDFTLHRLQAVSGVVVDERGAPLPRWYVAVESRKSLWSAGSWTDANGNFRIVGIPDGSTDLIVTNEDYMQSAVRLAVPSVLPAQGPLRIVVPDSAAPRSSIRMELLVDGKPAPVETQVRLRSASPLTHRDVHPKADGSVELVGLASQQFHLEVSLQGYASIYRTFLLGASEELDLGTIHISQGGRVHVQVEGPLSSVAATCHALDIRGRSLLSFDLQSGEDMSPPLPAGSVTLRINPADGATQFAIVEVVAGETTEVHFRSQPGTDRTIRVTRPGGVPFRFRTRASVTDALGHTHFYTEDLRREQQVEGVTTVELLGLGLGTYRILIQDPEEGDHESWFEVTSLEDQPVTVRLDW